MHLDKYGLPVQATGDANDQLQRVGMIDVAYYLRAIPPIYGNYKVIDGSIALVDSLQPKRGVYVRHVNGDTRNVSADQLISALAAHLSARDMKHVGWMFLRMCLRLGFAQNYKDGLDGSERIKLPDFMLFRALPLFTRAAACLYPLRILLDIFLVFLAIAAVGPVWKDGSLIPKKRTPDDVDDNNTILTLITCSAIYPTLLSRFASWIYVKYRPWNYGCNGYGSSIYHPVVGALRWYHRAERGGNPEIAEMFIPLVEKYLLRGSNG